MKTKNAFLRGKEDLKTENVKNWYKIRINMTGNHRHYLHRRGGYKTKPKLDFWLLSNKDIMLI